MQPARKDDPNLTDTLPDPRLNPMINPRLGKNLGRWAKVYYTTPPERRDQAVLELVRELEGGEVPEEEVTAASAVAPAPWTVAPASCRPEQQAVDPPHIRRGDIETQPAVAPAAFVAPASCRPTELAGGWNEGETQQAVAPVTHENPLGPISAAPEWRFCGHCGSPLKKKAPTQPNPAGPLLVCEPQPSPEEPLPHGDALIEGESFAADTAGRQPRRRAQILVVLMLSIAVGGWGLWHIRTVSVPSYTARAVPIVKPTAAPATPVVQPRIHQTEAPPSLPAHDASSKLHKPAAGTPVGCTSDHLSTCRADELYRKSMSLADGIDARFLAYDKRMSQLLREATAHPQNGARTKPDRLRQANYSAQLWERLQLKAYSTHEKHDALKLLAELTRRGAAIPKSQRNLLRSYENPQSCLELHYVADDLRRLAARLPRSAPSPLRASARRIPTNSP